MEKELFCPLPCLMAGHVAIGHPICIVNMPHVTVIIRHNCWLYRIPVFVAIIAFSGWIVNICQEAYVSLVLPHYSCWTPLVLTRMSPRFSLSVLGLRSLGMFYLCGLTVPQHKIFFWAKSGRKRSCPCTVYAQILLPPLVRLVTIVCVAVRCCSALCLSLPR